MKRRRSTSSALALGVISSVCACTDAPEGATATMALGKSETRKIGQLSPLIPFHKDAIHAALVWTGPSRGTPKVCFWMRPAEYRGTDLVDPNGLSPDGGETGGFIADFEEHVRGGSEFSNRLDRSVQSRIKADIPMDNGLCFDLTHPDAFANGGQHEIATYDEQEERWIPLIGEADFDLNRAAFSNAGHSAGLNYNVFCAGNAQLHDGRLLFVGGHDIDGDHGIRKINIFDPLTETWLPRPVPPVKQEYLAHPSGDHSLHPHPDANVDDNADPPIASDMKYQRWYPSVATLPDGRALILAGTDEDTGVPGPTLYTTTPEIYDPVTDRNKALENARKLMPNYPLMYVVQTGPGLDDWKVAVTGEMAVPISPILAGQIPAVDLFAGRTYYFDVHAAEAADINVPGENHWQLIDTALHPHHAAGSAALWELDHDGMPVKQRVAAFGGTDGDNRTAIVEMIDYQDAQPTWERQQDLLQPVDDNFAVVLPDETVLILGGESPPGHVPRYSLFYQLFDPAKGTVTPLVEDPVVRKDHTTALLLPDARVLVMGSDRTDLIPDDLIPGVDGDRDVGVPVARVYDPPYLFKGPRPVIASAPREIAYGSTFEVELEHGTGTVGSVVLIRPSPVTHKWDWENRLVKLAYLAGDQKKLTVSAPRRPASVLPGYYMLFVLSNKGVPSEAKLVHFALPN